jgi:hypothetical protein
MGDVGKSIGTKGTGRVFGGASMGKPQNPPTTDRNGPAQLPQQGLRRRSEPAAGHQIEGQGGPAGP